VSEIRWDALTGRPVIVAEARAARPNEHAGAPLTAGPPGECPFCEGREDRTPPEVAAIRPTGSPANGPGWSVRAFANRFPSLAPEDPAVEPGPVVGLRRRSGHGVHEVVVESPTHAPLLFELPDAQVRRALAVVRDRVRAATERPGVAAGLAFENCGPESGGTLWHPHAQVAGTPTIPPRLAEELARGPPVGGDEPGCLLERTVAEERAAADRIVHEDGTFTLFAPFGSEHPFALRAVPRRHGPSVGLASDDEVAALGSLLPRFLRALQALAPGASYNWSIASLPPGLASDAYHWHLELSPRLVKADGFELASGIPVIPVAPETAAQRYRAVWESVASPG